MPKYNISNATALDRYYGMLRGISSLSL